MQKPLCLPGSVQVLGLNVTPAGTPWTLRQHLTPWLWQLWHCWEFNTINFAFPVNCTQFCFVMVSYCTDQELFFLLLLLRVGVCIANNSVQTKMCLIIRIYYIQLMTLHWRREVNMCMLMQWNAVTLSWKVILTRSSPHLPCFAFILLKWAQFLQA